MVSIYTVALSDFSIVVVVYTDIRSVAQTAHEFYTFFSENKQTNKQNLKGNWMFSQPLHFVMALTSVCL